jgi:hypothetical protein
LFFVGSRSLTVEIESGVVTWRIEDRDREQAKIRDIHVAVAVDGAEKAEEALGIAEDKVAARYAIERLAASADLRRERGQRVAAVAERTEVGFGTGELLSTTTVPPYSTLTFAVNVTAPPPVRTSVNGCSG